MFSEFEAGMRWFSAGGRFLRREASLWPLAIVPAFLALVGVAIASSLLIAHLGAVAAWCNSLLPVFEASGAWSWLWVGPATFAVWVAGGLAVVAVVGAALLASLLAANLVSAPFLERLSLRVEAIESAGSLDLPEAGLHTLASALKSVVAEARRLACLAAAWLGLALTGLVVPGAQLVAAPLLLLVTLVFLPLESAGHAFDRRGTSLRERLRFVLANAPEMAGFGSATFCACLVPGLNLLVMPVLVTAGTLVVVRRDPANERGRVGDLTSFAEAGSEAEP